jgi:hypothetical protein
MRGHCVVNVRTQGDLRRRLHRFDQRVRTVTLKYLTGSACRVLTLAESDYQYGVGPLTLRVEQIDRSCPMPSEGEDWFPVEGVQTGASGRYLGRRQVVVRGSRLPDEAMAN